MAIPFVWVLDWKRNEMKAVFKRAVPYATDALNLPVADVDSALPFYEQTFNFRVSRREDTPVKLAILERDEIEIGLAENGGDPTQEGCYFEVDNVAAAYEEIKGKKPAESDLEIQTYGTKRSKVFFVVAPDGLCYMIGQPVD
jgi:catechol 2,3-dioxygenase-like lactoylglutathione lyase family enzyme